MEEERFVEASKRGNLVPLHQYIFSDALTPVLAYRCLVNEGDQETPSFLFESVEPGVRASTVGRYSVIGAQPAMEVLAKEDIVTVLDHADGTMSKKSVEDPLSIPRMFSETWKPQLIDELPDTFCGGWVGYFSYDTVRYLERKKLPFSMAPHDDRKLADIQLGLYDDVIVFDHVQKKVCVIHWVQLDRFSCVKKAYQDGRKRLDAFLSKVQDKSPQRAPAFVDFRTTDFGPSLTKGNMTREEYKNAVLQAKEHILAGDIFQIVLSQRFERRTFANPWEIYRALRIVNPSPFMSYLQARGCVLVASSPEILTRVKNRVAVNRPLAGTIRRGKTQEEDELRESQLLKDEKQLAEHTMLVDLARNDVGKICLNVRYGVEVSDTKVKAMELINQLEPTRRGPYSGGHGAVSFTGEMDIALSLRTMVFPTDHNYDTMYTYGKDGKRQEWIAHLQAGAGIVADSHPDDEQAECENKAAGMSRAIDLAEACFVNKDGEQPSPIGSTTLEAKIGLNL